jgi:hypothetical protein
MAGNNQPASDYSTRPSVPIQFRIAHGRPVGLLGAIPNWSPPEFDPLYTIEATAALPVGQDGILRRVGNPPVAAVSNTCPPP